MLNLVVGESALVLLNLDLVLVVRALLHSVDSQDTVLVDDEGDVELNLALRSLR